MKYLSKNGTQVENLDGMGKMFPQTGFSKEERDRHIRRLRYLNAILEKHDVTVVASFISPYCEAREFVRSLCRNFIEIHVATPLEVCEQRDPKRLYAKAKRGEIREFTGIDDPYEESTDPNLCIDITNQTVEESV